MFCCADYTAQSPETSLLQHAMSTLGCQCASLYPLMEKPYCRPSLATTPGCSCFPPSFSVPSHFLPSMSWICTQWMMGYGRSAQLYTHSTDVSCALNKHSMQQAVSRADFTQPLSPAALIQRAHVHRCCQQCLPVAILQLAGHAQHARIQQGP